MVTPRIILSSPLSNRLGSSFLGSKTRSFKSCKGREKRRREWGGKEKSRGREKGRGRERNSRT